MSTTEQSTTGRSTTEIAEEIQRQIHDQRTRGRRWTVRVLVGVLVSVGGAAAWLATSATTYTATASIYVKSGASDAAAVQQRGLYEQNRAQTYATLAHGSLVLGKAVTASGIDISTEQLSREISVQVLPQTVVLQVTVEDPSPGDAATLTNSVAETMVTEANRIEQEGSGGTTPVHLELVDQAVAPTSHASPDRPRIVVLTAMAGLLAALVTPTPSGGLSRGRPTRKRRRKESR